ncbi:hypothetical protein [Parolsenella catena]|uniref:hypothetical protein n=1 Tax=Parolsenella catena TaxID=2003188 RepID=UPI002E79AD78|nr:hypothetical protein [Parolsenella catena]
MTERIAITNPEIKKLEERCIRELEQYYPQHVIESGVDSAHKKLGERLVRARKLIGYESRTAMLEAWGFEVNMRTGHPRNLDIHDLLAELTARYEHREKPCSLEALAEENPDLKDQIRRANYSGNRLLGVSFPKELKRRGILAPKPRETHSEKEVHGCLEKLSGIYGPLDPSERPSTKAELQSAQPELAILIKDVPASQLRKLGILGNAKPGTRKASQPKPVSARELEEALSQAGRELSDVLPGDKPKSPTALAKSYPSFGPQIKAAVRLGTITEDFLYEAGILRPARSYFATNDVRSAPLEALASAMETQFGTTCLTLGNDAARNLPPHVLGIDAREGIELREALAVRSIGRQDLHAGDEMDVFDTQFYARFISETRRGDFHDNTNEKTLLPVYEELEEAWGHAGSPLAGLVGAKVVEVFEYDDERMARLELRYLTKLTPETLIGLLYNAGVIRKSDLLGGMGWRWRLGLIDLSRIETSDGAAEQSVAEAEPVAEPAVTPKSVPVVATKPEPKPKPESKPKLKPEPKPKPKPATKPEPTKSHNVNPMLLLTLLADDYVFFQDTDISWERGHHVIRGMQANLPKIEELNAIARENGFDSFAELGDRLVSFLLEIEKDKSLVVPRDRVSKALYPIMFDGDLTGITLANLAASMAAFRVLNDKPNNYTVIYDGTLADGIPHFFDLMCRLLWDLRLCMASLKGTPFQVTFARCRNLDLSQLLEGNVSRVDGAQDDPFSVTVSEEPAIGLEAVASEEPPAKAPSDLTSKCERLEVVLDLLLAASTEHHKASRALFANEQSAAEDKEELRRIADYKNHLEEQLGSAKEEKLRLEKKLAKLLVRKSDLQGERDQLSTEINQLEEKLRELEANRKSLPFYAIFKSSQLSSKIAELADQKNEHLDRIKAIDEKLNAITCADIEKQIQDQGRKIASLPEEIEAQPQKEGEYKSRLEKTKKDHRNLAFKTTRATKKMVEALGRYNDYVGSLSFTNTERRSDEYRSLRGHVASLISQLKEQGITAADRRAFPRLKPPMR